MTSKTPAQHRVAVLAHNKKTLGGGLGELREALARHGVDEPIWSEFSKSSQAPARLRDALREGADLILVWGGDGTVQRCIDTVVGHDATLAILPAGTANLLATNLEIPADLEEALNIALHGATRVLDVGKINGEHFAVMAGTGLDALMIRDADRSLKDRFGRAAYVWTGAAQRSSQADPDEDHGERPQMVRRREQLRADRQRRRDLRRHQGVRTRSSGRWAPRPGGRHG